MSAESLARFAKARAGDPVNGERLFFENQAIACSRCHKVEGRGSGSFGPDLTGLASKYDRAEIIRSILQPSDRVASGYQPVFIDLRDGRLVTGKIEAEDARGVSLITNRLEQVRIPADDIQDRRTAKESFMPSGLADSLTPVEFTDLISYLSRYEASRPRTESHGPSRSPKGHAETLRGRPDQ